MSGKNCIVVFGIVQAIGWAISLDPTPRITTMVCLVGYAICEHMEALKKDDN